MQEIKTIRDSKLLCDVVIYLGTGYLPSGWNEGHASSAFNRKIFPDPEAMFREMHEQNFRAVLHVLGAPHDLHGRVTDPSPDPDDAANYWRAQLDVFRNGINGWWVDDGDELSPASPTPTVRCQTATSWTAPVSRLAGRSAGYSWST
jgi:alpha-glucosidase/alpha-D-xyloside xylohydrolase